MLGLLLLVLPIIIDAAKSSPAAPLPVYLQLTEEAYRECDEQAIELVEGLAEYYCRDTSGENPISTSPHGAKNAMNRLFYLGRYAYRDYDFINGELPLKPAQLNPKEAMLMMRACLLQTSAKKFINGKPDPQQIDDEDGCVEGMMRREFDEPWEEAEGMLRPLNVVAMLAMPKRNYCLQQVFESFSRGARHDEGEEGCSGWGKLSMECREGTEPLLQHDKHGGLGRVGKGRGMVQPADDVEQLEAGDAQGMDRASAWIQIAIRGSLFP